MRTLVKTLLLPILLKGVSTKQNGTAILSNDLKIKGQPARKMISFVKGHFFSLYLQSLEIFYAIYK